MAGYKVAVARDYVLEVSDGAATPVFTALPQLTSLTYNMDATDVDLSNFDDDGFSSSMVVRRSRSVDFESNWLTNDTSPFARETVQARLETLNDAVGSASVGTFRLTFPNGTKIEFKGTVKLSGQGGGTDDKMAFGGTIQVNGKPTAVVA